MKQLFQNVRTGETGIADVPTPGLRGPRSVLVHVGASLVSAGTERMVVQFATSNVLQKIRSRPDLFKQVVDKARKEGVLSTMASVSARLDQPMTLGYSAAGTVIRAGSDTRFRPGDRVACAGANYAVHAEVIAVPRNLVVPVPDTVSFDHACFATLGAIALQGVRLADLQIGAVAGVIGLGLLGQITVQLLRASGVRAVGYDIDPRRVALSRASGASDAAVSAAEFEAACNAVTSGRGCDAVLICADTASNDPIELSGRVSRDKGVVVAVGAVGMNVPRKVFFEKELTFRISRSYGPGRYDAAYEEQGHDYPIGFVRWTEQRNLETVVDLMARRAVDVSPLITHRFPVERAAEAFDLVTGKTPEPYLAVLLHYPEAEPAARQIDVPSEKAATSGDVTLGVLGAGLFASVTMLPILKEQAGLSLRTIAAGSGLSAQSAARKFGFARASTSEDDVIGAADISTVALLTRHSAHARQVCASLRAGKNVFVEKPLCVNESELEEVIRAWNERGAASPALMVGFNRRFAPFIQDVRRALEETREPLLLHYRVNAGFIPQNHWTQDPAEGGRLIGEGCHFIDLVTHLANAKPIRVSTQALPDGGRYSRDNLLIQIVYANGTVASVAYIASGNKGAGKEFLEIHGGGLSARMDDFRTLTIHHPSGRVTNQKARLRQDKGHRAEWEAFTAFLTGKGPDPMPFSSIVDAMRATFAAEQSLTEGAPVSLD